MRSSQNHTLHVPIRRQYVKKIISYYDTLERIENEDRSRSRSASRFNQQLNNSQTKQSLVDSPVYDESEMRRQKLDELKELMKEELEKAEEIEQDLENNQNSIQKSIKGYPNFMPEREVEGGQVGTLEPNFRNGISPLLKQLLEEKLKNSEIEHSNNSQLDHCYDTPRGRYNSRSRREEGRLYSVDTDKKIIKNPLDAATYDYHQRVSKEIRRLQYSNYTSEKINTMNQIFIHNSPKSTISHKKNLRGSMPAISINREEKSQIRSNSNYCPDNGLVDDPLLDNQLSYNQDGFVIELMFAGKRYRGLINLIQSGANTLHESLELEEGDTVQVCLNNQQPSITKGRCIIPGLPYSIVGIVDRPQFGEDECDMIIVAKVQGNLEETRFQINIASDDDSETNSKDEEANKITWGSPSPLSQNCEVLFESKIIEIATFIPLDSANKIFFIESYVLSKDNLLQDYVLASRFENDPTTILIRLSDKTDHLLEIESEDLIEMGDIPDPISYIKLCYPNTLNIQALLMIEETPFVNISELYLNEIGQLNFSANNSQTSVIIQSIVKPNEFHCISRELGRLKIVLNYKNCRGSISNYEYLSKEISRRKLNIVKEDSYRLSTKHSHESIKVCL